MAVKSRQLFSSQYCMQCSGVWVFVQKVLSMRKSLGGDTVVLITLKHCQLIIR